MQLALPHRSSRKLSTLVVEVGAVQDRLMLEWSGVPAAAVKPATCGSFSLAVLPCTVEDHAESSKPEFGAATAWMRKWYAVFRVSPEVTVCDVAEAAGVPVNFQRHKGQMHGFFTLFMLAGSERGFQHVVKAVREVVVKQMAAAR